VKSFTVTLTSSTPAGLPTVLDHYLFYDPISGSNFVYPETDDGTDFSYSTGQPTVTADDDVFSPWGYYVQDVYNNISVGPLKGPYTINFDPTKLDISQVDILKIVYNFGDGSPEVIINNNVNTNILPQDLTQGTPLSAISPSAHIISHDYYPQSNTSIAIFNPSITVFYSNIIRWVYNISISSAPISIYEFDDIHLINNTQQLTITETQNIFEVTSPDYLTVARVVSSVDSNYPTNIPFDPNTSVLNYDLVTWLDASDSTSIGKNANNKVFIWYDKSAYENNYFCNLNDGSDAPTFLYPRQSQSGRKCVRFQSNPLDGGPSQYLYALASGPEGGYIDNIFYKYGQGFTIFAVMKCNRIGNKDTLFAYDLNTNEDIRNLNGDGLNYLPYVNVSLTNNNSITIEQGDTSYYFGTSSYDLNQGIYQPTDTGTISQNITSYNLFSITVSGNQNANAFITADTAVIQRKNQNYQNYFTTLSSFLSGGYNSITGKTVPPGTYDYNLVYGLLGTSDAYYGSYLTDTEISEFMVFDKPLNSYQIASVQSYLVNKWGLTLQTN
jgi:hypothetical protein